MKDCDGHHWLKPLADLMQNHPEVTSIDSCLSCGYEGLETILSFGETPVADHLLRHDELKQPSLRVPLDLRLCQLCSLVQLGQSLDPAWMFNESYPYFSSVTAGLLEHSRMHVEELIKRQRLGMDHLVVEIASNDGYLLQYFDQASVPVLGIEPCSRQAKQARQKGIDTEENFFNSELASSLLERGMQADVIIANNVLAHVPALNDFVAGISSLLGENGLVSIEVPYIVDLVNRLEFDTIYHQHLCYFSVTALDLLFRRHGLFINDLRRLSIHGGSLRIYAGKQDLATKSVRESLREEVKLGVSRLPYFLDFVQRVEKRRRALLQLLNGLKQKGCRIAAYGAAAKGNALLSYCGIDNSLVDYVVDSNPEKHNLFMSGIVLPVYPVEHLLNDQPDYVLMLVWNIADEVLNQQAEYRARGGQFIIPIPDVTIV